MGAAAAGAVALPSLVPETANGEDPQTMRAGAPGTLPALAEHGDGQNAHTVRGRAAGGPLTAADTAALVAEILGKATYTRAEGPEAVCRGSSRARRAVGVFAGDGDGGGASGVGRGDQGVAPLRVQWLVQRALLVLREQNKGHGHVHHCRKDGNRRCCPRRFSTSLKQSP